VAIKPRLRHLGSRSGRATDRPHLALTATLAAEKTDPFSHAERLAVRIVVSLCGRDR